MDNVQYNLRRYNRKKQWYRTRLGIEQFINYPILNFIWLLLCVGIVFLIFSERKLIASLDVPLVFEPVFVVCMQFLAVIFPVACVIGIMQFIGEITARKDEGNMSLVFGDRRDMNQQSPVLISKRKIKRKNVIVREFYTTIPMERWQEKKETIADILNVSIVGEIEYGGKFEGNKILFKTIQGRKIVKKDVLYDDTF